MLTLAYFAWPVQWGGGSTWVVVKGTSMRPNFHTGDIVIARESDHHEIGDILVYRVPEQYMGAGKLIMHRLKAVREDGTYVIQGDNRDTPDAFIVGPDDVVGVEKVHIPRVGSFMRILSNWWFIAGLVALFALVRLWPETEEAPETEEGDDTAHAGEPAAEGSSGVPLVPVPLVPVPAPSTGAGESGRADRPRWRPARAHVIVDGEGLARAGWPGEPADVARRLAFQAAETIGSRFGAAVALVLEVEPADDEGDDQATANAATGFGVFGDHVYVVVPPSDGTVGSTIREQVTARPAWMTVLVVTDEREIAEDVWALDGSVMRCGAWLALGPLVDAPLP